MTTIKNLSKSIKSKLFLMLFLSTIMLSLSSCKKDNEVIATKSPVTSDSYRKMDNAMHKLWADHMQWTFATVDAYFNNPGGLNAQLTRLLKNQEDIGAATVPFYGQAAGDQLTVLLNAHINGAIPVLEAAKNSDNAALTKAVADWHANAQEIADFLSAANPENWEQAHMRTHMDDHITKTIDYSVALLQKNYDQAIIDYDIVYSDMMHMALSLSEGIGNQFPSKF